MFKPRLQKHYEKIVCEDFLLLYNFQTISQLATFERAIFHSTSNKFVTNKLSLLQCFSTSFLSTGQRSEKTRAHKSIALFSIRQGNILGLKTTLRKAVLYNFLDKLLLFVVPKLLFDWRGNPLFTTQENPLFTMQGNPQGRGSIKNNCFCVVNNMSKIYMSNIPNTLSSDETQITPLSVTISNMLPNAKISSYLNNLQLKKPNNFVVSSKNITNFPEISQLILFFNLLTGFCFDCHVSVPIFSKNQKQNKLKQTNQKGLFQKKQFVSAFQYPVEKL